MSDLPKKQAAMKERQDSRKKLKREVLYQDRVSDLELAGYDLDFFTKEHVCKFCRKNPTRIRQYRGELLPCKSCAKLKIVLKKYNLTLDSYWRMWKEQHGCCAICNELMTSPSVDHCRDLLHCRGILCPRCNSGLGYFKDNPALFRRAVMYIEKNDLERKWWVQKDL
jgi:hypothetical protein